jgi:chromate transporter
VEDLISFTIMHEPVNSIPCDKKTLKELAFLFLKLGIISFGGPAAHIAIMENKIVRQLKWLTELQFLDLFSIANLIPGPTSTELAILIGNERAGWKGLIISGLSFIMPAVVITGLLAVLYKDFGQLPQLQPFIYGIKPAIIAIILAAIYPLAKKSVKTVELGMIGLATLIICLFGVNQIYVLFGAGLFALTLSAIRNYKISSLNSLFPFLIIQYSNSGFFNFRNLSIFLTFLKVGAVLYGSGYMLFAFLDTELVSKGIISRQQLIDAIAVGQFTPGPVFSSVTFIGYQINGLTGAIIATI